MLPDMSGIADGAPVSLYLTPAVVTNSAERQQKNRTFWLQVLAGQGVTPLVNPATGDLMVPIAAAARAFQLSETAAIETAGVALRCADPSMLAPLQ